jgi:methylglyoxal/glyoxal reductase
MKDFNNHRLPEFMIGNGGTIPCCGIGTYGLNKAILLELFHYYQYSKILLDTAAKYDNEKDIAFALRNSNIRREDVFITSKISFVQQQTMSTRQALFESLTKLETEYLDLYLIHSPRYVGFVDTWKQLMELQSEKLIKYIGVSNFTEEHLQKIFDNSLRWPDVNQIAINPFSDEKTMNLIGFCKEKNILIEAAMPFGGICETERWKVLDISRRDFLRCLYKRNIVSLPGTQKYAHMLYNFDIVNFS